jgi:ankyrin repeat protein
MPKTGQQLESSDDTALLGLFGAIASGNHLEATRRIRSAPDLATRSIRIGASRQDPKTYFLVAIHHYVYAGDTALHVAAASLQRDVAESLVVHGAPVRARNRRGAEPLHYAADWGPEVGEWSGDAQRKLIAYLINVGANPDAVDNSGVAPLHRAVRNRSSAAVDSNGKTVAAAASSDWIRQLLDSR